MSLKTIYSRKLSIIDKLGTKNDYQLIRALVLEEIDAANHTSTVEAK